MDIEEAKKQLLKHKKEIDEKYISARYSKAIEVVLNELDKKDKIINEMKWKPISKYNRKEYDWVLVKYFDGDYECVPGVAEKRSDDRWYNLSGEIIPFEVKYFFDMQILDYFTNKVEEDK